MSSYRRFRVCYSVRWRIWSIRPDLRVPLPRVDCMPASTLIASYVQRRDVLRQLSLWSAPPWLELDGLVRLAAAVTSSRMAVVALVDDAREWFPARVGVGTLEVPFDTGLGLHAMVAPDGWFEVADASLDPRTAPFAQSIGQPVGTTPTRAEGLGSVAAVAIRAGKARVAVGYLGVFDSTARTLDASQRGNLTLLARQVEVLFDARASASDAALQEVGRTGALLQSAFEAMQNGIVLQHATGQIVWCNPAAERILGLTRDQMEGRTSMDPRWRSIRADGSPFPGDEHPAMVALRTGQPVDNVLMGIATGSEPRWIQINARPIRNSAEEAPHAVVATFADVTALLQTEQEYRQFFSLSLEMLCIASLDGFLLRTNPAWTRVLGWSAAELDRRRFLDLVHPDDAAATVAEMGQLAEGKQTLHFENRYQHRDGGWRTLSWQACAVPAQGTILAVARDVTAEVERRAALQTAKDAAERADRAKGQFLATMSHEIRTPINGMLGMAELLADTPLSEQQRDLLGAIRNSGRSLVGILNDILDWSKIEAGSMTLQQRTVNPIRVARQVLDLFGAAVAVQGIALQLEVTEEPLWVRADRLRLQQVLTNLISNGVKFTPIGSVRVRLSPLPGRVLFEVIDTGVGIAAEQMPRLFQRFSQLDGSNSRQYGGTGLGLAISKFLVEAMGGELSVLSEPGKGSTFAFSLLAASPEARHIDSDQQLAAAAEAAELAMRSRAAADSSSQGGSAATDTTITPRPLRVLLAEDNLVNRRITSALLARSGHACHSVENGRLAVEAFAKESYDLVLMDVQMPVMDGFAATQRIRALEREHGAVATPILATTASALAEEQQACLRAGMDAVLVKPFTGAALAAAIDRLVGSGRAQADQARKTSDSIE